MSPRTVHLPILALIIASFLLCPGQAQCADNSATVIKVLVNVLTNADFPDPIPGTSADDVAGMIADANKILQQANIRLDFDKSKNYQKMGDGGNNDGVLDKGELQGLNKTGLTELTNKFNGKGIKITLTTGFGVGIMGDSTKAFTAHDSQLIYIAPPYATTPGAQGNDLAHEVCHCLTLSAHSTDTNNLMYPQNPYLETNSNEMMPRGTNLTMPQQDEIKKKAKELGETKLQTSRVEFPRADWVNPADLSNDTNSRPFYAVVVADTVSNELSIAITLDGLLTTSNVNRTINVFLDTDNNPSTGESFGPFLGIEKRIQASVQGAYPFTNGSGSTSAVLYDIQSGLPSPLAPPTIERIQFIRDSARTNGPPLVFDDFVDEYDSVVIALPLNLVEPLAAQVPTGLFISDAVSGAFDQGIFILPVQYTGPALTAFPTQAMPGDLLSVSGGAFSASSSLNILFADQAFAAASTDSAGTFSTQFACPALSDGNYFVTFRDANGLSDFFLLQIQNLILAPIGFQPSGQFQLFVSVLTPHTIILEKSVDLRGWNPVSTNSISPPGQTLTDPNAGLFPTQFYRVHSE